MNRIERLAHIIGNVPIEDSGTGDNVAIALATYYEEHNDRPKNDYIPGDDVWGKWVETQTMEMLNRIAEAVIEERNR